MTPTWRRRSGIQLCYPFEERRLARWGEPTVLTQPKLDGERCRAVRTQQGRVLLLSSTEELITGVPALNNFLECHWPQDLPPDAELDGELYRHGWEFEAIHSVVSRTVNQHPDHELIQLHCFDLILPSQPNTDNATRELLRREKLGYLAADLDSPFQLVQTKLANGLEDVAEHLREFLDKGYEGVIVRHPFAPYVRRRATHMMKFKPRKRDSYRIAGYKQEVSKDGYPKSSLGALILESEGETFSVGTGFTQAQREELWKIREALPGLLCTIDYQSLTPGRTVPKFASFVSLSMGLEEPLRD